MLPRYLAYVVVVMWSIIFLLSLFLIGRAVVGSL